MKVRALSLLIAGAVIISTLTGCGKSSSDKAANEKKDDSYQKIELVMAVNGTDIQIDARVADKFAELVEEETDGNVTIDREGILLRPPQHSHEQSAGKRRLGHCHGKQEHAGRGFPFGCLLHYPGRGNHLFRRGSIDRLQILPIQRILHKRSLRLPGIHRAVG